MQNYHETDPEFAERFDHFAFDEVVNEPGQQLEPVTRHMAILATLLGCQGKEEFAEELPRALDAGLTPVMVKEIVYQAVDYLGIGRVRPFLDLTNEELERRGVALPLEPQATTTMDDRLEKGAQAQAAIFGPQNETQKAKYTSGRAPCKKGGRGRLYFLKIRMQRQTAQVLINFLSASGIPASSER